MPDQLQELQQQVERLWKVNKWMLIAIFVVGVFTGGLSLNLLAFFRGNLEAPRITTHTLDLTDKDGKIRASFATMEEGAGLFMYDVSGQVRGEILVTDEGGVFVNIKNSRGERTVGLAERGLGIHEGEVLRVSLDNQNGFPKLAFCDRTQKPRLRLILWPTGPHAELLDENLKPRAQFAVRDSGAYLAFHKADGRPTAGIDEGGFSIEENGILRLHLGRTDLMLLDEKQKARVMLGVDGKGNTFLKLIDAQEKPVFERP